MRYLALATDYDGTLAKDGVVSAETLAALQRFRQSGRRLILVTGREMGDLEVTFPRLDLFDRVVAENGVLLYAPDTREKTLLTPPPPPSFAAALKRRGVPFSAGDGIVATWRPHETAVLEAIRDLGLDLQVVFNKEAVMVLPAGVNKKSGLEAALNDLGLSAHNVAGVGDAENDHAFLSYCEFSAAVANALPAVKQTADLSLASDRGRGVVELIDMILADDLAAYNGKIPRRLIPVGRENGNEVSIPAYGGAILVAGASGSGKSTFIAGLLERLIERKYQVCLIDPEGDYEAFPETIALGDEKSPPSVDQILQALNNPASQAVVNLAGAAVADRPEFLARLLPRLEEMRLRTGRPYWIILDEAHHMLPAAGNPGAGRDLRNVILIAVHPSETAASALRSVDAIFALGPWAGDVIPEFSRAVSVAIPSADRLSPPGSGEALVWFRESEKIHRLELLPSSELRMRHKRKYAHGELGEDRSFYFRGPRGQLNLRAQNLMIFLQMADGLDDETWSYHLKRGDYSIWFREKIKDEALADEAQRIECDSSLDPRASREKIKAAIEQRYTAPA